MLKVPDEKDHQIGVDMQPEFISSEIYRQTGYSGNHPLAIQRIGSVLTL